MVRFVFGNQQFAVGKLLHGRWLVHAVEHINTQRAQLCRIVGRLGQQRRQRLHADKRRQRSQKTPTEYGIGQVDVFELFVRQQTQPVKMIAHLLIDLFAVAHNLLHHFPILVFLHLHTVFVNQDIGLAAAEKARLGTAEAGSQITQFGAPAEEILHPSTRRLHFADTFGRSGQQREHDGCGGGNHKRTCRNQKFG